MKTYRSHKVVKAAKIVSVTLRVDQQWWGLQLEGGEATVVSDDWVQEKAQGAPVDGYFVEYENGYQSWSPADAFEAGYTEIEEPTSV